MPNQQLGTADTTPTKWKRLRYWFASASVLAIGAVALVWNGLRRHVAEVHPGTPNDIASFTSVAPPAQASNIQIASYEEGGGWGFSHYVRFEAPSDACRSYAAAVVPGVVLTSQDLDCGPFDRDLFKNTTWFDLAQAQTLIGGRGHVPRPNVHVWVDLSRGVFYFLETD